MAPARWRASRLKERLVSDIPYPWERFKPEIKINRWQALTISPDPAAIQRIACRQPGAYAAYLYPLATRSTPPGWLHAVPAIMAPFFTSRFGRFGVWSLVKKRYDIGG